MFHMFVVVHKLSKYERLNGSGQISRAKCRPYVVRQESALVTRKYNVNAM